MTARAVVLMVVLLASGIGGCTGAFFQPQTTIVRTPDQIGVAYEDVYFRTADGVLLNGWFLPGRGRVHGTLLFLHGNAENISTHIGSVYWLPQQGFNVFLPDYRGYGRSQGKPTLAGLQEDIDSSMRYLIGRGDVDPRRLAVFGQSLGGALAVHYVAHSGYRENIRALVIDSAFASYRDIAREKLAGLWLGPLAITIRDEYSPIRSIGALSPIPVLVIHCQNDVIIPVEHARRLYEAAKPPKDLWVIPNCGHIQALHTPAVRERFAAYLNSRLAE